HVTTRGSAGPPAPPPPAADAAAAVGATADAAIKQPPPPQGSAYDRAIGALLPQMNACMTRDPSAAVPTAAMIHIAPDGHPMTVTLQPDPANPTPLGPC